MPAAIAIPLITAAASTGASIYAANRASSGANRAARGQTQAANYAADLQDRSAREALDYQKAQAAEEARRYEIDRRANWEQWAAREGRLGTLSQMWGFGGRQIPGYVSGTPSGASNAPTADLGAAQAKFNALFPGETLTPDMVKAKEAELTAAGFTLRPNAKGTVGKIQYGSGPIIDIIQGADSGVNRKQWLLPQNTGAPMGGSIRDMARRLPPPTMAETGGPVPLYQSPSTLRSYLRRG